MKRALLVIGMFGCKFSPPASENPDAMFDDGGHEIRTLRFDSAAEWAAAESVDMTIEPRGSLTPDGFVYGGLIGRGVQGTKLWDHGETNWFAKTATATPNGAGLWPGITLTTAGDLRYLGIATKGANSIWFEGEIFLVSGQNETLRLIGNDVAYADLAQPGSATYTQILESNQDVVVPVTTTGWYPIRIGWADGDNAGGFDFQRSTVDGFAAWPRNRMRAPARELAGTIRTVFFRQMFGGGNATLDQPPVTSIDASNLLGQTSFDPPLQGSPTVDVVDWSARWAGQIYASAEGTYTLQVDSDDGHRIVVGTGAPVQSHFARGERSDSSTSMASALLVEGWNDFVVDYNDVDDTMSLAVKIVDAPGTELDNAAVPKALLRPVEPRGDRLATKSVTKNFGTPVVDDLGVFKTVPLTINGFDGESVTAVDLTVRFTTQHVEQLVLQLTRPGGTPVVLQNHVGTGGGTLIRQFHGLDPNLIGQAANGNWIFGIADDVAGGNTTQLVEVHLTLHTSGGPEQVALASSWSSPILDTHAQLFSIESIMRDVRAPTGSAVTVHMRSCDAADCSDAEFGDAIGDQPPALAQRRYVQVQVQMTCDGTHEPELRELAIVYKVTPQ